MKNLPNFPNDAVFQYMSANREGVWRGFRILRDQRLLRTNREGQWEEDTPLDRARYEAVHAAVAAAKLEPGSATYGVDPAPDDATGWVLHSRQEAGLVVLSGLGCRPAFVDALIGNIAPHLTP